MKFVSTRDLCSRPGYVRELAQKEDLVLTADGKPIAILLSIENEDLQETALAISQAKAQRVLSRMRHRAASRGIAQASPRTLEAQIQAVRRKRKSV